VNPVPRPSPHQVIRKMGQYLKMSMAVPEEYLEGFVKADNTFLYQLVFDPLRRKVVPLNPYPEHLDPSTLGYAGLYPQSACLSVCPSVCPYVCLCLCAILCKATLSSDSMR